MFISQLSSTEAESFMAIAVAVCQEDGVIHEEEQRLIESLAREANLLLTEPAKLGDWEKAAKEIKSRSARIACFAELVGIVKVDGDVSTEESQFLKKIALSWEISEEEILYIKNWIDRQIILIKDFSDFIQETI